MELRIMSPQEGGFAKEIQWNNEELKAEIAAKMTEYEGLVFTEDTIKDAKKDRATLNKLKTAFEDERKRIKKAYMDPYNKFESQVKEVVALIERPIGLIDSQIKEVEENKKLQKKKDIEELFRGIGFQSFVTLDKIFDNKWLNATVSMTSIETQMKERIFQIGSDIHAINQLPEFSFEAMETYKETLDLGRAISEGQKLADIQKRKIAQEEEWKRLQQEAEERKRREAEREKAEKEKVTVSVAESLQTEILEKAVIQEQVYTIDFRVTATKTQLDLLKNFLKESNITYGPVPQKGE
ncbi:DUF1351 domain-containing protein [Lachnospiraceae bacterium EP-SM-12S-S03]|nr:DUF1351 domain-containing protein [Lachnospiraceae bacterium EP-SM-12S-S03]